MRRALLLAALLTTACGEEPPEQAVTPSAPPRPSPAVTPPAPGQPGGLGDERAPVSEALFDEQSAQGAANVLQTYYALVERGKYEEAFRLREPGKRGPTQEQFAASFAQYAEHHATVGTPSQVAGAAGSLYVEVPVQLYGRMKTGRPFSSAGTVTLRRPSAGGSWRIYTSG